MVVWDDPLAMLLIRQLRLNSPVSNTIRPSDLKA